MTQVRLSADVFQTTVTLADVTGLQIPVTAGQDFEFEWLIAFRTAATTTGLALTINGPANSLLAFQVRVPISATAEVVRHGGAFNAEALGTGVDAANAPRLAVIRGVIRPTANGDLIPRYRSEIAGSEVRVLAGSTGRYRQLT